MVEDGSLIVVHFVEQQLEGWTFTRDHWPLHITLVPWFKVADEEAVLRSLERIAGETAPLHLGVGGQEQFGINKDVPVNVFTDQQPVMELHQKLLNTLKATDTSFHEQRFMGQEYVAHITRHVVDGRFSNEGEEIVVNQFHLVRLVDSKTCKVEQQFYLGHGK